ncbi:NAD(P)-binding protein [Parathielavia appendiculata]|uniref:NAD(P)-binding protein n=1 Tax=Parathielavia appendiculata TaxID=2587402 RepID=A0AAN6UA04_9PEZI|nr:NAD(P)-binding protein [Parathielavia appendiculata]
MSSQAILVLGGTGTVGSRIVRQLSSYHSTTNSPPYHILIASRNGTSSSEEQPQNVRHVSFDWHNADTWSSAFSAFPFPVRSVYLIAPLSLDADRLMTSFVDFARERGARRFVLQSASSVEPGGPAMGKVHSYLRELGTRGELEWAVLRPTWFQQNFANQSNHVKSIREESKIYSATGEGKIPWVAADDIAAVAVRALTNKVPPNTEYLVLGSELLSYGEIAGILTDVLGRKIVHVDLSAEELEQRHQRFGMPEDYSKMMSAMDTAIKFGSENRTNDVILAVTGAAPRKFRDFALSAKDVWETGKKE